MRELQPDTPVATFSAERRKRPAIRASSLSTQVYDELRQQITEGRLSDRNPLVILTIAREFGISHTPVREALARLHAEGLTTFTENIGYRVAPSPTSVDYSNWMQARLVIEVGAMRTSVLVPDASNLAALEEINGRIRQTRFGSDFEDVRLFSELNRDFHRALIAMCANPFLMRAYDQIWLGAQFSRVHYESGGVLHRAKIAEEHQDVLEALRKGDLGVAARKLETHIVNSLDRDASRGDPNHTDHPVR